MSIEHYSYLNTKQPLIKIKEKSLTMLISPFGGRILHIDFGFENLLWVNPSIRGETFSGWNIGGIRTWFSPERALYYKNPSDFSKWFCPNTIDPLDFKVNSKSNKSVTLFSEISLQNNFTTEKQFGTLLKSIELHSFSETEREIKCKIKQKTVLKIYEGFFPVAIWTIAEIKPGDSKGEVIVPLKDPSMSIDYFNKIPKNYLKKTDTEVHFKVDGEKELKLGIPPEAFLDPNKQKMSYNFVLRGKRYRIEILSFSNPTNQQECLDVAKSNPEGLKGSLQVYNSNYKTSGLKYAELETHSKPLKLIKNEYQTSENVLFEFTLIKD